MSTRTLEQLYRDDPGGDEYAIARATVVGELAEYLVLRLKRPSLAHCLASGAMANAEIMGRIVGNEIHGEISGRYTITGNPLPF